MPLVPTLKGDLWNQIIQLIDNMPNIGSGGFVVPGEVEKLAFAEIVTLLNDGNLARSVEIAAANHYQVLQYIDRRDADSQSYMLREMNPIQKGWGLYIFRIGTAKDVIIEAPHPRADENTSEISLKLYRALDAKALLIAGAHRDANEDGSADITHTSESIFEVVHETIAATGSPLVLQIHGFRARKHPGYPQVVLGHNLPELVDSKTAQDQVSPEQEFLEALAQALRSKGISVGICDKTSWQDLCGEKNIQSMTTDEGKFIHIELDETMRSNRARLLISALIDALRQ